MTRRRFLTAPVALFGRQDAERRAAVAALVKEVKVVRVGGPFPIVRAMLRRLEDRLRDII